ncbi:hypothetical protein BGZ91_002892 [Linnemannia elongata]|nr:hypothetical protein BGZ91_002892 [Linnemannia elongata]
MVLRDPQKPTKPPISNPAVVDTIPTHQHPPSTSKLREVFLWSNVLVDFRDLPYLQHDTNVVPFLKEAIGTISRAASRIPHTVAATTPATSRGRNQTGTWNCLLSPQNQEFPVTTFPKITQVSTRANESDLEAQVMLGDMCYEGKGGDSQNYHAAMHWYLQTAEQGDPEGQRKVGLIYEYGAGVSRDRTWAVAWYLEAVAQEIRKLRTAKKSPVINTRVKVFREIISKLQIGASDWLSMMRRKRSLIWIPALNWNAIAGIVIF